MKDRETSGVKERETSGVKDRETSGVKVYATPTDSVLTERQASRSL